MRGTGARLALVLVLAAAPSTTLATHKPARQTSAVRMNASFDPHARLGGSSALTLGLHVDTRRVVSPVTAIRLAYPRGLGIVSSGLGLAACNRPAEEYQKILITSHGLGGCPPNAVMGYGTARASVRLVGGAHDQVIPEYATLSVLSGPIENRRLKLVIFIDGQRPFGARLILAGAATDASPPYGGALLVKFPQIASLRDLAVINLSDLQVTIGARRIRYLHHGRRYRPEGIALPTRCPRGGFKFRLDLDFADGVHRHSVTSVRCPGPSGANSADLRPRLRLG
jgi:hypothetical protein